MGGIAREFSHEGDVFSSSELMNPKGKQEKGKLQRTYHPEEIVLDEFIFQ